MNATLDRLTLPALRLGAILLLLVTWALPAWNKLSGGGVPPFFTERFGGTFLASFPGIPASFYSIAILEALAALLALGALVTGEFFSKRGTPLLMASLLLSVFVFVQLGFGLRLTGDNDGAHNLFMYTVGAFVVIAALKLVERQEAPTADAV